jgi:hypothetical protein
MILQILTNLTTLQFLFTVILKIILFTLYMSLSKIKPAALSLENLPKYIKFVKKHGETPSKYIKRMNKEQKSAFIEADVKNFLSKEKALGSRRKSQIFKSEKINPEQDMKYVKYFNTDLQKYVTTKVPSNINIIEKKDHLPISFDFDIPELDYSDLYDISPMNDVSAERRISKKRSGGAKGRISKKRSVGAKRRISKKRSVGAKKRISKRRVSVGAKKRISKKRSVGAKKRISKRRVSVGTKKRISKRRVSVGTKRRSVGGKRRVSVGTKRRSVGGKRRVSVGTKRRSVGGKRRVSVGGKRRVLKS